MPDDCLFCKIAAGTIPSKMVHSDDQYYAFEDINPGAPKHVLVIPRKHIATLNDLADGDAELVGGMVLRARMIAEKLGLSEPGYRLTFNCNADAGQSVWHIHLHLLGGRRMSWPPG